MAYITRQREEPQHKHQKNSDDCGLRSPLIQKRFQPNCVTSIVSTRRGAEARECDFFFSGLRFGELVGLGVGGRTEGAPPPPLIAT